MSKWPDLRAHRWSTRCLWGDAIANRYRFCRREWYLRISKTWFGLSNIKTRAVFTLSYDGPVETEFVIRRKSQALINDLGKPEAVEENPLHWLRFHRAGLCDDNGSLEDFHILVSPDEPIDIEICDAPNEDLDRWEGSVEVHHRIMGNRAIDLSYMQRPDGQWSGKMVYLADFDDAGIDSWIAALRPQQR